MTDRAAQSNINEHPRIIVAYCRVCDRILESLDYVEFADSLCEECQK